MSNFKYVEIFFMSLLLLMPIMLMMPFFVLGERKVLASIQKSKGPDSVGFWGLLQPMADGLKLIMKELIKPTRMNWFFFIFAPMFSFWISLMGWALIPFDLETYFMNLDLGLMVFLGMSSLGIFGMMFAGWSSNSSYALLGSLRAVAQLISYEIILSMCTMPVVMLSESLNFIDIMSAQNNSFFFWLLLPCFLCFGIGALAETNSSPFDLAEAEAEMVAGYHTEHSSIVFAFFFLAEYSNMLLMCSLTMMLFFGGWMEVFSNPFPMVIFSGVFIFSIKVVLLSMVFMWMRGTYPSYRYDQLMSMAWSHLFPFLVGYLIFLLGFLYMYM